MKPQRRILLLADDRRGHTGNLLEHIAAFGLYSRHPVSVFNPRGVPRSRFLRIDEFDVVVIHYSLVPTADSYLPPFIREQIREFAGLKIQFLQDEYRWVESMTARLRELGIDILFTITPERELDKLYGGRLPGVLIVPTLAGFVPEALVGLRTPPTETRPIDVGYRGRVLPFWNGALSQEKVLIGQGFLRAARPYGLRCDIAWGEHDRIYGERWIRFLTSCKATLGAESGTSISDFDGSIERDTIAYLAEHPGATFAEVQSAVLAPHEGNVMMNVPSPRIFEAAALRTTMVLFPGEYGGVVQADEHYLPLERDFSNMDEVAAALRDVPRLKRLQASAYGDIVESGKYSMRREIERFDDHVDELSTTQGSGSRRQFALARMERPLQTRVIGRIDTASIGRALTWDALTARFVLTDPPLAKLVATYVTRPELWRRVPPRRLQHDLLRLALLRRAQSGSPVTTERFTVHAVIDRRNDRLTFVSSQDPPRPGAEAPTAGSPHPGTILWNHGAVGYGVHVSILGRWVGLAVGYHGTVGVHHFGALERLADALPGLVDEALEPLFERPGRRRRRLAVRAAFKVLPPHAGRQLVRSLRPRPGERPALAVALVRAPRNYAAKSALVARIVLSRPRLRALLRTGLGDAAVTTKVGKVAVVEDIVKLFTLQEANAGRVPGVTRVEIIAGPSSVTFRTRARGESRYLAAWPDLSPAETHSIRWDNREVGHTLNFPTRLHRRLAVSLEPDGVHLFPALTEIVVNNPSAWSLVTAEACRRPGPARQLRAAPRDSIAKALVVALAASRHRAVRQCLRRYLTDSSLRAVVELRPLSADIVKLYALDLVARGRVATVNGVRRDVDGTDVRYTTTVSGVSATPPSPFDDAAHGTALITWDNRATGNRILILPRLLGVIPLFVLFDADNMHQFDAWALTLERGGNRANGTG